MRIILLTRGTGGDFYPFVRIGKTMQRRGHEVIFMTHGHYGEKVKAAGLGFAAIDEPQDFDDLLGQVPTSQFQGFIAGLQQGLPSLLTAYEAHHDLFEGGNTLLLAHQNTHLAAQFISEKHNLPIVSVFTAPHFVTNMIFWEEIYLAASDQLNGIRAKLGLPSVSDWRAWWRTIPCNIGLWPEWFAPMEPAWPVNVKPVGFILNEPATQPLPVEAEQILRRPQPTLLITHATSATEDLDFFGESIEACRSLGWQALLVTPHRKLLPAQLPDQTYYFPALPFDSLLPRVKAVIHHGGIGTLAQSIAANVPQVILGVGFDRPDNAMRVKQLGIGEHIPLMFWQADAIAQALHKLTQSPDHQKERKRLSALVLADNPLDTIGNLLETPLATAYAQPSFPHKGTSTACTPGAARSLERGSIGPRLIDLNKLTPKEKAYLALRLRQKNA